jgi:hypothetical protein
MRIQRLTAIDNGTESCRRLTDAVVIFLSDRTVANAPVDDDDDDDEFICPM